MISSTSRPFGTDKVSFRPFAKPSPIRTVTVGFGFSPNLPYSWLLCQLKPTHRLAGLVSIIGHSLYRRSGIAPCPEGLYAISMAHPCKEMQGAISPTGITTCFQPGGNPRHRPHHT